MPFSPFVFRFGLDQGRIQPDTHVVSPDDMPAAAVIVSLATQPFVMEDQDILLLSVDGGLTQQILFETGDFVDIESATATEVAAVLTAQLTGATVDVVDGKVRMTTLAVGLSASFNVTGGTAQNAIQFPSGLIQGTQGVWSFVLGHETAGLSYDFTTGDSVTVRQTADFNDALIWRMRGAVHWRPSGNEAGSSWRVTWRVGATTGTTVLDIDQLDPQLPVKISLDDIAVNVSGLAAAPTEISVELETIDTAGAGDFTQELPAVIIDFVELDETADALELANRFPTPDMVAVTPTTMTGVEFDVLNTTANALDLSNTRIVANGQIVFDAGAFVGPFSGSTTASTGPASRDTHFALDLSSLSPYISEEPITIEVITETSGDSLEDSWSFIMEDTVAPQIAGAQARSKTVVRVFYSEAVLMDTSPEGALNVGNYEIFPQSAPAVTVTPQSVVMVTAQSVDVTVDLELSLNANYKATVKNVTDTAGNELNPAVDSFVFPAFRPLGTPGRSFQLWDRVPVHDRKADEAIPGQPFRKFTLILQDVVDILLCDIDRWTEIIDIDLAPESFLNAILRDLGNPFDFVDLDLNQKRKLARILVDIYKEKGTEPGVINAIRFFLGVEVELDIINCRSFWRIGVHQLNLDTIIGPGEGSPLWYSFFIVSPVILTEEQREQMLQIADYMKAAHEHLLGVIEPGGRITRSDFWNIGIDTLGTTTVLGA